MGKGQQAFRFLMIPVGCVLVFVIVWLVFNHPGDRTKSVFGDPLVDRQQVTQNKVEPDTNPIPPRAALDRMSLADMSDFYHGYISSTQALCNRVLRMGNVHDGGWDICDDPLYKPARDNCLVYSMGINGEWSYDDAIARYGCEVHSYDPSMTKVEDHIRGEKIHFHQVGIGGEDVEKRPGKWALFTLATLRKHNGHSPEKRRLDVVKMDVEGAEVPSLRQALKEGSLRDVRQLSFEIHMFTDNKDPRRDVLLNILEILRGLWDTGFRLYLTSRNQAATNIYTSKLNGVARTRCLEVNMVNAHLV